MTLVQGREREVGLSIKELEERRAKPEPTDRMMFQVAGLYGLSAEGMRMPLSERESIDSGQVSVSLDPEASQSGNIGMIDFERCKLRIRYAAQVFFPGLYDLITSERHDISLLNPIRAVATDNCEVEPDYSGWRALGTLEFLPGSLWAGAGGG